MVGNAEKNGPGTEPEAGETCQACHQFFDKADPCSGNYVPLTRDEETILARMRQVKAEVTELKRRLKALENGAQVRASGVDLPESGAGEEAAGLEEQRRRLEALRSEWQELDRKRQEAAAFRMKLLGHED